MKSFFAWIEERGPERKNKVVISLTPRRDNSVWNRELTTIELGEVHILYTALTNLIQENPKVFYPQGMLRPIRGRTTLVIEHDLNTPLNLDLPSEVRVVSRYKEELDPAGIKPGTVIEYSPPPWR